MAAGIPIAPIPRSSIVSFLIEADLLLGSGLCSAWGTSEPTFSWMLYQQSPQSRQKWLAMSNGISSNRAGDLISDQQDIAWLQCLFSVAVNASVPPLSAIHTEMINEPNIFRVHRANVIEKSCEIFVRP